MEVDEKTKTRIALAKLDSGHCFILSAPRIDHAICGVSDARISAGGEIKLVYEGGIVHRAPASDDILDTAIGDHSLFRWVSCVQEQVGRWAP